MFQKDKPDQKTTKFDSSAYMQDQMTEHLDAYEKTRELIEQKMDSVLDTCATSINAGGKIMFFGNGGSAADAQHLATELSVRFINDRKPIAGLALTTDTSTLTAAGNDYGFEYIFARQIEAMGKDGDVAFAISTSGNSPNILRAIEKAKEKNITVIGLSGKDGGRMKTMCDDIFIIPSNSTARIQEMHIFIGHLLCGGLEHKLGLIS